MKAIQFSLPGDPDVLDYGDAPDPQPAANELLVRVRATAVNRADVLQRRGGYAPPPGASPILGLELAGEVVRGAGAWHPGDRVMAVVTGGGYAELAAVPAGVAMPIPKNLSFEQAAAIPEAFLTAFLNLFTIGQLESGRTVLIHAGASGVGTAAIQLARMADAHVIVTAGDEAKLARCRELGAHTTINYKTEGFADRVLEVTNGRGVDLILELVGASNWEGDMAALTLGGRLLLIGFMGGSKGSLDLSAIMMKNLTITSTTLRRTPLADKIKLSEGFIHFALPFFENGRLFPVIDTVLPIAEAAEAHRRMERNQNIGKIVLRV